MSAYRVQYLEECLPYESLAQPIINIVAENIAICDKHIQFTREYISTNHIGHIVCILPSHVIANDILANVKGLVEYTVLDYGDVHEPGLDPRSDKVVAMIDELSKKFIEESKEINKERTNPENYVDWAKKVLIFCNNGYQRTIPFLVHYLMKQKGFTLEEAVEKCLNAKDRNQFFEHLSWKSRLDEDQEYKKCEEKYKEFVKKSCEDIKKILKY